MRVLLSNTFWIIGWIANLDPTLGTEIRKTRPVIVISSDEIGIFLTLLFLYQSFQI